MSPVSTTLGRLVAPLGLLGLLALMPTQGPTGGARLPDITGSLAGPAISAMPTPVAGCATATLDGTLLTDGEAQPFSVSLRTAKARIGTGPASLPVLQAACSSSAITFAIAFPDGGRGTCALSVEGSEAAGDCTLPGGRAGAVSAILDRTGLAAAPLQVSHGS